MVYSKTNSSHFPSRIWLAFFDLLATRFFHTLFDEILRQISQAEITSDNAANVAEEVADITGVGQDISLEGLNVVADLLQDINGINSTEAKVGIGFNVFK